MSRHTNPQTSGIPFIRCVFRWTCVLALVFATPTVRGATDAANAAAIQSNLPANVTFQQASMKQTAVALYKTILQHHDDALDILRVAILAKTPRQDERNSSCEDLCRLVRAACTGAPDRTSKLVEMAASLHPSCADSLQDLLATTGGDAPGTQGDGIIGFGVGFGPGVPGAPSFVGATATGSTSIGLLPPASPSPLTPIAND